MSLFVAYKTGYKSGGFDNSALPSATLGNGDIGPLLYESETGEGFEGGIKSMLMGGSLRLNATAFYYVYEDLQVQLFDAVNIQFTTFNAGELTTQGLEADFMWATGIEGLTINGAIAFTDAEYSKEFINNEGDDLNGRTPARTADMAGNIGFNYETSAFGNWNLGINGAAQFSDSYGLQDVIGARSQGSYWLYDAGIRLFSSDNRYEIALIGMYGARTLAVTLNGAHVSGDDLVAAQQAYERELGIPVVRPLEEGLDRLVPVVREYIQEELR